MAHPSFVIEKEKPSPAKNFRSTYRTTLHSSDDDNNGRAIRVLFLYPVTLLLGNKTQMGPSPVRGILLCDTLHATMATSSTIKME